MSATPQRIVGLAALVTVAVLWVVASDTMWWRRAELAALDLWYHLRGPVAPTGSVALVMIDEASVDAFGGWPIPRQLLGDLVDRLIDADASVIAFDLLFSEPGRQVRDSTAGPPPDTGMIDRYLLQDDRNGRLADAMERSGRVIVPYAFVFSSDQANVAGLPDVIAGQAFGVVRTAPGRSIDLPVPAGLIVSAERLAAAAVTLGHVSVLLDVDGSLRRDLSVVPFDGLYFPSLPLEVARLHLGIPRQSVVVTMGETIKLGDRTVPVDPAMGLAVNYYGPEGTFDTYRFADVLDGTLPPGALAGRVVLIGASVLGLGDTFSTPFSRTLPGAEYLATVVENVLRGEALSRPAWSASVELAAIIVLGGLAFAATRAPAIVCALALGCLVAGWGAVCALAFARLGVWIGAVGPVLSVISVGAVQSVGALVHERRRRRAADRSAHRLSHYFDPQVAARLSGGEHAGQGPQTRQAAILFADIADFTAIAERLSASGTHALLQQVHARIDRAVAAAGGTIDKYLGDGAMACFGTLAPTVEAPRQAMQAARLLIADIEDWNRVRQDEGEQPLVLGIGIHYGPVLVGDVGTARAAEFTVVGDAVNVASRLEALTRELEAAIVVSDAVVEGARACGAADELRGLIPRRGVAIRGRQQAMSIWLLPRGVAGDEPQDLT